MIEDAGETPPKARRRWPWLVALAVLLAVGWGGLRYRVHEVTVDQLAPLIRPGDVILVRRGAYDSTPPGRWDVVLLRDPRELRRVVVLPGEQVRFERGDLWLRDAGGGGWQRPVRPEGLRNAFRVPVYPLRDVPLDPKGAFVCEGGWTVEAPGRLRYAGGTVARARLTDRVTTESRDDAPTASGAPVNDVRIDFQIVPQDDADLEVAWTAPDGWEAVLTLSTRGTPRSQGLRVTRPGAVTTQTWAKGLVVGRSTAVVFQAVDGAVEVQLNGERVQRVGIGLEKPPEGVPGAQALSFGARGGALDMTNVRIERDGAWDAAHLAPVAPEGILGRAEYVVFPFTRRGRVR